ncbi:MAG: DNA polymerase III subunit alpha, partial [Candidatus Symbiothrix sp.]|nr:DNA polymerase III subunit alpha [Candidatus Symbiothrix sp.]
IVTYGTMATKSSIKDVARVQGLPLDESNRLAKLVDNLSGDKKLNLTNCIASIPELKAARYSQNPLLSDTLKYAEMLEGTVRQTGVHACGVIIGADDLTNFVPLATAKDKNTSEDLLVTQYEGSVIESVGLIKMDFLGLKTLSIIKEALSNIKKSKGLDLDIDHIPDDDKKTYELYSKGLTIGTFQFESPGMQKYLKELQPTQFEDLIAMNALYRPGPMQYIPSFINRKHGKEQIQYDFPEMEKRLKDTYGITVYQEQVMLLSRDLAGFTRGQSDELRKAMGKKLVDKMAALKEKFLKGAKEKGHDETTLEKIWSDWAEFAKYAFNKSHATCYSWVSYQTAYLKAHYPAEFMAANLTRNLDNISEITKFMDECRAMDINVLGPDVNESDLNFTVNKKGDIRFGLGGVKGVGRGAVEAIVQEREANGPFKGLFDFVERVNLAACNKKNLESLTLSGAFDNFPEATREQMFAENSKGEVFIETLIRYGNKYQTGKKSATQSLFGGFDAVEIAKPDVPKAEAWGAIERLNKEKELIGIYLSSHPLDEHYMTLNYICNLQMKDLEAAKTDRLNQELVFGGIVTKYREGFSKSNSPYGIITLEDFSGTGEIPLFGKDFIEYGKYGRPNLYLLIRGAFVPAPWNPTKIGLQIRSILSLSEMPETNLVEKITITLPLSLLDEEIITELSSMIKDHPGNTELNFRIEDSETQLSLSLMSNAARYKVDKLLIKHLQSLKHKEITFKIN